MWSCYDYEEEGKKTRAIYNASFGYLYQTIVGVSQTPRSWRTWNNDIMRIFRDKYQISLREANHIHKHPWNTNGKLALKHC